jgi:hypothetical protein
MKQNIFFFSSYELTNDTVKYMFASVGNVLIVTEVKEHLGKPEINHFQQLQD